MFIPTFVLPLPKSGPQREEAWGTFPEIAMCLSKDATPTNIYEVESDRQKGRFNFISNPNLTNALLKLLSCWITEHKQRLQCFQPQIFAGGSIPCGEWDRLSTKVTLNVVKNRCTSHWESPRGFGNMFESKCNLHEMFIRSPTGIQLFSGHLLAYQKQMSQ